MRFSSLMMVIGVLREGRDWLEIKVAMELC